MPFDGAAFSERGDPSPRRSSSRLAGSLKEWALCAAATLSAFLVGGLAGALVDGLPAPASPQAGSIMGQIAGTGSFLVVIVGFVWWRVHRQMADL